MTFAGEGEFRENDELVNLVGFGVFHEIVEVCRCKKLADTCIH